MSKPSRSIAVWLILTSGLFGADAWAQAGVATVGPVTAGGRSPSPGRRGSRADPLLRRQAHQGRADPRHQEEEVRGTVTHTLSPLHPYLTQVELDCGSEAQGDKVTVGPKAAPCTFTAKGDTSP